MSSPTDLSEKATELYAAGNFIEAEPLFRQMLSEEPENPQVLLLLGLCRRGQGDLGSAAAFVQKAAEFDQSNPNVHFALGAILLDQNRSSEAAKALERCIELYPNHGKARALQGYLFFMQGELSKAVSTLKTALKADPDQVTALSTLALAQLQLRDLKSAHAYANKAVEVQPDDAGAQSALGQVFMAQGHVAFAEQCLRNALQKHPNNPELSAVLANILRVDGRHDEALAFFIRAAKMGYNAEKLAVGMSDSLVKTGRRDQALQLLEDALQSKPDDSRLKLLVAQLRFDLENVSGCEALLETMDSELPSVQLLQARLAASKGQSAQAKRLIEGLKGSEDRSVARQAQLMEGKLAIAEKDFKTAEAALSPFLSGDGADPAAIVLLSELAIGLEKSNQARTILTGALEGARLDGGARAKCHQLLAYLYDLEADYATAGKHLQHAGFQPAPMMRQLVVEAKRDLNDAWLETDGSEWDAVSIDDNVPEPVVVLGWPGSGRGPLLTALAANSHVWALTSELGSQRASSLNIPARPSALAALDESQIREGRQVYLSGESDSLLAKRSLETVWWENSNLPALARFFPNASIIIPELELADLELMWRLSGYADIQQMIDLWHREKALLEHFEATLDLHFERVKRKDLLQNSEAALTTLCDSLSLEFEQPMLDRMNEVVETQQMRPDGHWRHYQSVLTSCS